MKEMLALFSRFLSYRLFRIARYTCACSAIAVMTPACLSARTAESKNNAATAVEGHAVPAWHPAVVCDVLVDSVWDVSCHGIADGAVFVTPTGTAGPVTYLWSDGSTAQDLTGLPAGTYTVTVTDSTGCMAMTQAAVLEPDTLDATFSVTDETCEGSNGDATVNVSGGTPSYTYAWSNAATTPSITGLAAGAYTVTVTDDHGCIWTGTAPVGNLASPVLSIDSIVGVRCFGEANGAVFVSVAGVSPPYAYLWSNTATTQDLLNATAGTYALTVTDSLGCIDSVAAVVTEPAVLSAATVAVNETCDSANGSATVTPAGGTMPYTYLWSGGQTAQTATGLAAATYTVTVTDGNGCTATKTQVVLNLAGPSLVLDSVVSVVCSGQSNGAVYVSVSGGTVPYAFLWSGGATTEDLAGIPAGTYTVTVTDSNGCVDVLMAMVTEPAVLGVTVVTDSSYCGNANGTATAVPSGGTSPYAFAWTGGQTSQTATGLAAGTYTVTVTDGSGCSTQDSGTVVGNPAPAVLLDSIVAASCFGLSDGAVYVSLSGGTGPFTYLWSNASTTQDIVNVASGTYSMTVTDGNGCTGTTSQTVVQPTQLGASVSTTNATCGNANGTATVTPSGGSPAYAYAWSTGQTTQSITGLLSGVYTVTVTDANACTKVAFANVNNTNGPSITVDSVSDVLCNGQSNGAIYISAGGGTAPYSYAWSNGATTQDVQFLAAGTYTVTVTDANTCTANQTQAVSQPTAITAVASHTNSTCSNPNGTATVTVSGGVTPYTFLWSTGQTTQSIAGLSMGSYTVTITDANGCIKTRITILADEPPPVIFLDSVHNVSCFGLADGGIYIHKAGGAPPVTYLWSVGLTQQDLVNVVAGTYTVTVTDQNGCTDTLTQTLTQPPVLIVPVNTTPSTCGAANGGATAMPSGGTPPYAYLWSNAQTGLSISGITAGTYTVTVTDSLMCTASGSGTVTDMQGPALSLDSVRPVSCNGMSDGAVYVSVSSGTSPFSYAWSGGATTQDLVGVPAGTYTVTVTDNNGCTATLSATVSQPAVLTVAATPSIASCGLSNGGVTASPAGGTAPYAYAWNTGQTTQAVTGLAAATYTVTVTDARGCTAFSSAAVVNAPGPSLSLDSTVAAACFGGSTGAAYVSVASGSPPLTYAWSGGATTQDLLAVAAGTYTLVVTDTNGCTDTLAATIGQPVQLNDSLTTNSTVCGGSSGSVQVWPYGGTAPYGYMRSTGSTAQFIVGLAAGPYTVTVTDANGCTFVNSAVVSNIGGATITLDSIVPVKCNGQSNGAVYVTVSSGTPPYVFQWNPGPATEDIVNVPAGSYTLIVQDDNGCFSSKTYMVPQPDTLKVTVQTTNALCGGSNGSANANPTGGTSPYGYLWSTAATTQGIVNVTAGSYTVTVTDSKGCTRAVSATVGNTPAPTVTLDSIVQVKCNGDATGGVYISVSGAAPPFTYAWSTGAATQDLSGVGAGTYTVTVTDANNCTKTVSYSVNQPQPISQTVSTTPSTCGAANGTATSLASGGVSPYAYLWAPGGQTTASISNLAPGSYTVTVTDANGCTKTGMGVVGSTNNPVVVFDSVLQVSCNGAGNGAIYVSISGGQSPFAYNWTPGGATTQDITGLQPNCYHLIVIDANNCIAQADTCITQPAVLSDSLQKMHETCGNMNGMATVFPVGGTAPFSYTWSTGATTQSVSGLAAGNYTATITDANGCTRVHIIAIQNLAGPSIVTDSVTAVRCFGESNGGVLISVAGGTAPFSYAWSPGGQTAQDLTGVGAGTYAVTVTDANGCTAVQSFAVNQPPVLADSIQAVTATCGNGNGSATVFVYGGVQPYSYIWSSGSVSDTIQNKPAGSYVVTVTDANGCTRVDTVAIGNVGGPVLLLDSMVMPSCTGSGNGGLYITAVAGAAPFSYLWSNGAMTKDNPNIPAGTYTVTVTDSANCSLTMSWPVTDPPPVGDSLQIVHATCGFSNGSMTVFPFGGTGAFTYLWSTGATTQTISNLAPGVYTATVTDGKGCSNLDFGSVNNLAAPVVMVATVDSVQCYGGGDGNVTLSVTGGTPPLAYLWSTGATTVTLTGVAAGPYTVTVTDANGCTAQAGAVVGQPDSLVTNLSATPALCNDSNGCAIAMPTGGTGTYQYLWSNGDTSAMACGLFPGVYAVTVTDAHGCLGIDSVNVPNVGGPTVVVDTVLAVACHGDSTGAVLVTVSGGAGTYQYAWSQGATSQNASGLPAGMYTLTVTDSAGCTATISQVVTEPAAVSFNGVTTPSNCDTTTGTVAVAPSGGIPGYALLWSTGATTQSIAGLAAGAYTVTVTDGNQCQADTVLVVSNPPSPVIDTFLVTDVTCYGGTNGYININVTGGTLPYSFLWSDFSTNEDLINSPAGVYTVTVTDGANCTTTGTFPIDEPTAIVIQFAVTDAACGDSTGQVIATVSGGTGPYALMWSTGAVTDTLSGLPAGSYTLTVTDSNSCTAMQIANVSNLSAPVIQVVDSATASCYGALDGYVVVSVSGGTPPYSYAWTNTLQTGDSIYNLAGGMTYTLTITDANNCKSIRSVYVGEPDSITVTGVVPQVNGIYHVSCFGGDDGSINITPSGGTPPYTYSWSNFAQTEDLTNLPADTFTVVVTDTNGCKKSQSFVLLEPPPIVADAGSNFILCGLNYDTLHAVVPAYGTGHWELKSGFGVIDDPNAPVTAVTGLGFGNNVFVWIVSDGVSKCNDSSEVIVSVQSAIIAIAGTDRSVCADSVVLTATPPQFGYGYWQVVSGTGAVQDTAKAKTLVTGLSAGTNVFRWTVINGLCSDDAEVRITRLDPSECLEDIHMPTGITPNGDGKNDVFVIRGLDDYADNSIMIYNRWGNKVFEQSPYLNNWKGTNQHGDLLQEGTYFVILRIGGIEKAFTGYIDLRR